MTTQFHCFAIPGTFFLFNISHDRWNYGMICSVLNRLGQFDIVMLTTSVDSGIALSRSINWFGFNRAFIKSFLIPLRGWKSGLHYHPVKSTSTHNAFLMF